MSGRKDLFQIRIQREDLSVRITLAGVTNAHLATPYLLPETIALDKLHSFVKENQGKSTLGGTTSTRPSKLYLPGRPWDNERQQRRIFRCSYRRERE